MATGRQRHLSQTVGMTNGAQRVKGEGVYQVNGRTHRRLRLRHWNSLSAAGPTLFISVLTALCAHSAADGGRRILGRCPVEFLPLHNIGDAADGAGGVEFATFRMAGVFRPVGVGRAEVRLPKLEAAPQPACRPQRRRQSNSSAFKDQESPMEPCSQRNQDPLWTQKENIAYARQ